MNIQKIVKDNIKLAIKQSGKTKKEVCENADIHYNVFSQHQSVDQRRISAEWIYKIAKETGVTTDFIFGIKE